jgi:alpha-amylase
MTAICFYFQVHQPYRIKPYTIFDIGKNNDYFDEKKNREIMLKVAKKCYLPMNTLLLKKIKELDGKFKVAFSISGIALDQMVEYAPEVLESFQELAKTGCVEFLAETNNHSLSFLYSLEEFKLQVEIHKEKIKKYFNYEPKVFRNTELIYTNRLAHYIEELGYKGILAEGWDSVLGWRSPNFLYHPKGHSKNMTLFLKNYKLSDDIAFRFSNKGWSEWPLTTEKYVEWINQTNGNGEIINLFMDYETFGEHQWEDTGIFDFMERLPNKILEHKDNSFLTPSEAIDTLGKKDEIDVPFILSWADMERDLSAWVENDMQKNAIKELYSLEKKIKKTKDKKLLDIWRKLTTSDHFYYMCTKYFNDGDVHKYFSAYSSPYDAYIYFMNVLRDLEYRLEKNQLLVSK